MIESALASAPASIGNVGVGFDVLGLAFGALRDEVTAVREAALGVRLGSVTGLVDRLPETCADNSALAAAKAVLEARGAGFGLCLSIVKNIPISGGMGGSAACAVAGAGAANALLDHPFDFRDLLAFAMEGERVSADPPPWDNVAASLHGGLVLVASEENPLVRPLRAPAGVVSVLVHPSVRIDTRSARGLLRPEVPMRVAVEHSRRIAAFVAGCASGDLDLIRAGLEDLLVEPQRVPLLPALPEVKAAALAAGALGCSFSGSGPAMFAWATEREADAVEAAMMAVLARSGIDARAYRAPVDGDGLRVGVPAAAAG